MDEDFNFAYFYYELVDAWLELTFNYFDIY